MSIENHFDAAITKIESALTDIEYARGLIDEPPVAGIPFASEFRLPFDTSKAWYEATRRYGPYNFHPERCEDWNLESGGNTDLGEPLFAPFAGLVLNARNCGGTVGRVVQILGFVENVGAIVWTGWHLHQIAILAGVIVEVGAMIGSIGNADGWYRGAHLHEQICIVGSQGVPSPTTFASDDRYDWQQPSKFYVARGVDAETVHRCTEYDGA